MTGLIILKQAAYAVVAAHLLHEATHYGIAWLLRTDPSIGIMGIRERGLLQYVGTLYVDHHGHESIRIADWAIHLGPTVTGVVVAAGWVASGGQISAIGVPVFLGWAVYTLVGVRNDIQFREVNAEEMPDGDDEAIRCIPDGAGCAEVWEHVSKQRSERE